MMVQSTSVEGQDLERLRKRLAGVRRRVQELHKEMDGLEALERNLAEAVRGAEQQEEDLE